MKISGFLQNKEKLLSEKNALNLSEEKTEEFEPIRANESKYNNHYILESKEGKIYVVTKLTYNNSLRHLKLPGLSEFSKLHKNGYLK